MYVLGILAPEESAEAREHVEAGCPKCLAHLREAAETLYFVSQTTRQARPDPALKTRLLRRVRKK